MSRCANGRPVARHSRPCSPPSRACPRRWPSTRSSNGPPAFRASAGVSSRSRCRITGGQRSCARTARPPAAVHIAAVTCLERIDSPNLPLAALDRLPRLAPTVQAYYAAMLLRSRPVVVENLQKRLKAADDPALPRLAEFAARLGEPALRERLTALADHADPEVRVQSARALGSYPHRESVAALKRLVVDTEWAVRAQAARSLGMIADVSTLPLVQGALRDGVWGVRLRAALALMRCAGAGRNILLEAEIGADPFARAMAKMVLGLPPQALAEFSA